MVLLDHAWEPAIASQHSEPLSWAMLISAPFVVSALTFNGRGKITSIINLTCLAAIAVFVYFLSSTTTPWNLASTFRFITHWRETNPLIILVGIPPSILVHVSLICMLCIAPRNIKALTDWKNKYNSPTKT